MMRLPPKQPPNRNMLKRLYICADLEGVAGVVSPRQVFPSQPADEVGYRQAVRQLQAELLALMSGLNSACAALGQAPPQMVVNDAHARMANLSAEAEVFNLPNVTLISGKPKLPAMVATLDRSYDALVLMGCHAKAATPNALLCHSFNDDVLNVSLNGISLGEAGMNMAYAWLEHGVPTALVVGDDATLAEVSALASPVLEVETKQALGWSAGVCRPVATVLAELHAMGETLAKGAAQENALRFALHQPELAKATTFTLSLTLIHPRLVDILMSLPNALRVDGLTVELGSFPSVGLAYRTLQTAYSLLAYQRTL